MANQEQLTRYMNFLKLDPRNFSLIKDCANCAYELGLIVEALSLSRKGVELQPDNQEMQSLLGLCYLSSGESQKAKDVFQQLIDAGLNDAELRYNLAFCLALDGQYEGASKLLTNVENEYLKFPQIGHLKVRVLHYLEEIDEAISLGKTLLGLDNTDAILHGLLSTLYIDNEDFEQAKQHAEQAISFNTTVSNPDAISSLGTLALSEQDDALAVEYFDKALQMQPKSGRAWLGLGMANMLKNELALAEKNLESALLYMPEHLGTWQALTWCQLAKKETEKAEATVRKSLLIDHNFAESHGVLAIIYLLKGQIDAANTSMQRALKLDPHSFSGLYAKSLILQNAGKTETSEKLMQTILDAPLNSNQASLRSVLVKKFSGTNAKF